MVFSNANNSLFIVDRIRGALSGLFGLVLPSIAAPPLLAAIMMAGHGIAWGVYSIRVKSEAEALFKITTNPTRFSTQNYYQ